MIGDLLALLERHPRLVALTGAGISAASGIPTYRNDRGEWQRSDPIQHQDFVASEAARRRYWARSMAGWPFVAESRPNRAHHALARLEQELEALNPTWRDRIVEVRPDGDAEVADAVVAEMRVPGCRDCGGTLMPDVVFFGGTVPRPRVEAITQAIEAADALLVAGSSLQVFSGFRFCRQARALGKPLVIVNRGQTRADSLATLKVQADAGEVLDQLANSVGKASERLL